MIATDFNKNDIVQTILGEIGYVMVEPKTNHFNLTIYFPQHGEQIWGTTQHHTPDSLKKISHIGKRAPRGYRIHKWIDGTFHVYRDSYCIEEAISKSHALLIAWMDWSEKLAMTLKGV